MNKALMGKQAAQRAGMIVLLAGAALLGFSGLCWGASAVLNAPPYVSESLSARILSANIDHQVIAKDVASGEVHLLLGYVAFGLYGAVDKPFQLVDANLTTGVLRQADAVMGRPNMSSAFALHPNGKYYIASNDPGYLYEYDLKTGAGRSIRALADKAGMYLTVGDDGKLYIGEAVKGYLERYDPETGAWDNYGILDDPGPPYYRYAYSVGADGRYAYVGMGKQPWYLVVYDTVTGSTKTFWKDLALANVTVYQGTAGGWYANASGLGWFALTDGQPVPIQVNPKVVPYVQRGGVCGDSTFAACNLPWEIDLGRATPSTASADTATAEIAWRRTGGVLPPTRLRFSGDSVVSPEPSQDTSSWQRVKFDIRVSTQQFKQLVAGPGDGEIFGFTSLYGPVFRFTNNSEAPVTVLGTTQRSNYDALYLPEHGRWYIAGYPRALLEYDPSAPWTLIPGRDPADPSMNPHQPVPGFGEYHYYLAKGADSLVYIGSHHERDSVGGSIGWFDPVTRTKGMLRTPFERFDVRDLQTALNGQKLVYSSASLDGLDAKLFVFDIASKTIEREITPLKGVSALDKIVETSPGIVVGVVGSTVYSVDIRNGQLLYQKTMSGQFSAGSTSDRRLRLASDDHVWLVLVAGGVSKLTRINPVDGSVEMLQDVSSLINTILLRNASGTGYDALLYGQYELRRLSDVLR